MLLFTYVLFAFIAIFVVCQCAAVAAFVVRLSRHRLGDSPEWELPKAAVVLSVRGPDPYLDATLQGLLQQDYPDYRVFVVVDNTHDPSWQQVNEALANADSERLQVSVLREPKSTCSLKCSSLVQAVQELDSSYQVVAFLDGDAPPHAQWLRTLVRPLRDPSVGVATGNRWFMPKRGDWGSLVRYFWNGGAVVQVWLNGIVWAGSMAMRREVIATSELLESWSQALSVDGTVCRQMRQHRLKVQFVPALMMINEEDIPLNKFVGWVSRQMVAAKSCGPGFRLVALHAGSLIGTQLMAAAALIWGLLAGHQQVVLLACSALAAYWLSALLSVLAIEYGVRCVARSNGTSKRWMRPSTLIRLVPSLFLTHVAYACALVIAYWGRRVSWRGVEYEIRGTNAIRMVRYRPYVSSIPTLKTESVT
ncbi:MAG: glycosyltransferase family 2 protein [Pirellulaceae bacterium]|nr:glycosyltransferase family 2 protein [Pirellulaceae bacterium]